jgi:competence protein ComEC
MCITGFSPSVVRASIMAILVLVAGLINRKNDVWTSISISLLAILIYNPYLIKSVGVMLSYGGTIGIIVFNKNVSSILKKLEIKEKKRRINPKIRKLAENIKDVLAITISAQIVIMPIIIVYFKTVSLTFLICNLLVSFIIGPIVILGFIAVIASIISAKLLVPFYYILKPMLEVLIFISNIGSNLPINKFYICTPNMLQLIIYYMVFFSLNFIYSIYSNKNLTSFNIRIRNLIALFKYKFRQNKKKVLPCVLAVIIIFTTIYVVPGNLKIYFIDVGQGDSTLIITPKGKSILIDGGGSTSDDYDVGKSTLLPYLLSRGVNKIDYMVVSHTDQDHIRRLTYSGRGANRKKYNNR